MNTHSSFGQNTEINAELQAELQAPVVEAFGPEQLDARERAQSDRIAREAAALCLKALLHRVDPQRHPVSADPTSLEARAAACAAALPALAVARLAPGLKALSRRPTQLRRLLGEQGPSLADLRPAGLDARLDLRPSLPALRTLPAPSRLARATPRSATQLTRCHLLLRAIHCVRETQPAGWDEIIFGGLRIGASGNVAVMRGFDAGDFRTGHYASYGELFLGQYSLRTTPGYPKSLYAIFQLVESDSNDAAVARALTDALSSLVGLVVSFFATAAAGAAAAAAVSLIGNLVGALIDEDALRPYGIRLTLNSQNQFGGAVGPKQHTGNITGHGGIYRIGYRWVLGA